MTDTRIEWTDSVWNPTTGCDKVSDGCTNCYALTMAGRLKGMGQAKYQTDGDPRTSGPGFGIAVHPDALEIPLRWRKPRRVFVNSMSDLFHDGVPSEFIARVFAVMALTPQHTYQVLTKRHGRMRSLLSAEQFMAWAYAATCEYGWAGKPLPAWPLPNVWLGVSVEDQKRADLRVPVLLDTPAAVRWLSCEPLLGPVDLRRIGGGRINALAGDVLDDTGVVYAACPSALDWVVVGGESGPGARPMHPDWARSLRDQCVEAAVPYFFKQWGEWAPAGFGWGRLSERERYTDETDELGMRGVLQRVGKRAAGRELDGRTWDEYPERTP